jgi:hypothetical protein
VEQSGATLDPVIGLLTVLTTNNLRDLVLVLGAHSIAD